MEYQDYPWPDDFPPDVPPDYATPADGIAFRLVVNDPPVAKDFVGHNQEPHKKQGRKLKANDFGTSMYRDCEQAKVCRDFHVALRSKKIAEGELQNFHGSTSLPNSKTHFEAWLRLQTGIETSFKVID
ncbi:hypothetical protein [Rosenbergiella epipactidis]|uniref:hypothetical protein n=1 Tax=Rosenbergiella epipactidis TaxID=1544694 RepID=UPI001F4D9FBB|nr:hypothetical protein [Rosenbergiella epipactidis]